MELSKGFFDGLRGLALTLEKEAKQLERALRREDADYEEESPIRVLHDLHCEIKTLKEDLNASLAKSCSEKQVVHDFMKASEILMRRNAADLGNVRELFQKYGYEPPSKDSTEEEEKEVKSDSKENAQNKSDEEKTADAPHLPACTEKPPAPKDPLCNPQLSDFGLSQYAFSRLWSAEKGQHITNAYQENSKNRTPPKPQTPSILPKTPKCMLKMDDYECVTPKIEQFGISEHTMCLNEDYTISLMHKTAQTTKKFVKDDHEVNVSKMTSKEIMVTPKPKSKVATKNADWMASPFVFCTPNVKTSSRINDAVLAKSPETNKPPIPSHAETPQVPKFEARWLKTEAKEVKQGEKIESVTKNGATDKQHVGNSIPFAVSSDEYLKHFGDPSPPKIKHYDQLLDTPPSPEITRIPDDVLQILSKYNHNIGSSKVKAMESRAGNATQCESDFTDHCNKENRGYSGCFKTNI